MGSRAIHQGIVIKAEPAAAMTTMLQHIARHFREKELDGAHADIRVVIRCPKASYETSADAAPAAKRVKVESSSGAAAAGAGGEDAATFTELDSFPGHSLVLNYSEYFRAQRVRLPALNTLHTVVGQCVHCCGYK
jgi:hypothetical protein